MTCQTVIAVLCTLYIFLNTLLYMELNAVSGNGKITVFFNKLMSSIGQTNR